MTDPRAQGLTLGEVGAIVRRRWALVAAVAVATIMGALLTTSLHERVYIARAEITLNPETFEALGIADDRAAARIVDTQIRILRSSVVAEQVRDDLGLPSRPPPVVARRLGLSEVIQLRVRAADPETARTLTDAYITAFNAVSQEQRVREANDDIPAIERTLAGVTSRLDEIDAAVDAEVALLADGDRVVVERRYDAEQTELRRQRAELAAQPGGSLVDQAIAQIDARLAAIDAEIEREVARALEQDRVTAESARGDELRDLRDRRSELEQRIQEAEIVASTPIDHAIVTQPAIGIPEPISPRPLRTLALATAVGLALGLAATLVVDRLDDTIRTPDHLARVVAPIPLLATIPTTRSRSDRPITMAEPSSPAAEAFARLRGALAMIDRDGTAKVLQVISPRPHEGRTTVATNLAVVLARSGERVVLVDADLRSPAVHELLGLSLAPGLVDALRGASISSVVQQLPVGEGEMTVLTAGAPTAGPGELLGSDRMTALLIELGMGYDTVLLDSSAARVVADAEVLARVTDGVIVVVRADQSRRSDLRETLDRLSLGPAPVLGLVLVGVKPEAHPDRRYTAATPMPAAAQPDRAPTPLTDPPTAPLPPRVDVDLAALDELLRQRGTEQA